MRANGRDGTVGVTATYGLDESRDDVVVHFTPLVIGHGVLLQSVGHNSIVDNQRLFGGSGVGYEVNDVEQFAGVTSGIAEKCGRLFYLNVPFLQLFVGVYGPVEQLLQVLGVKRFEYINLAAREEWSYYLKRWILGRGSDEGAWRCRFLRHRAASLAATC